MTTSKSKLPLKELPGIDVWGLNTQFFQFGELLTNFLKAPGFVPGSVPGAVSPGGVLGGCGGQGEVQASGGRGGRPPEAVKVLAEVLVVDPLKP